MKLEDYCLHITDGEHCSVIDDASGEYYLLSNKNIVNGGILIGDEERRINKETFDKINKRILLEENDVLVSTVGTLGKTAVVKAPINYTFQRSVGIVKPDPKKADPYYLKYLLDTEHYQQLLLGTSSGAIQKCIFISTLKSLPLQLPDLATQRKVSKVLSALDRKCSVNREICADLDALARQLYNYWFVQFDFPDINGVPYKSSGGEMVYNEQLKKFIPKGWEVKTLKQCIKHINTGLNPRDNFVFGGDIRYITVKNLTLDGVIDFTGCDFIDEPARTKVHRRSQIEIGDVLYASICPLGRTYQITSSPEDWDINESVFAIRPDTSIISPEYLDLLLKDEYYVRKLTQSSTGSIFQGIRIHELESTSILVPSYNIVKAFSEKVYPLILHKAKMADEISALIRQRTELLPLLMNGQVIVDKN